MKCLDNCGWNQMPNNLVAMERHLEECIRSGAWSREKGSPVVIWKDGAFVATTKAGKKDTVFAVKVVKHVDPEEPMIVPYAGADPIIVDKEEKKLIEEAQAYTAQDPNFVSGAQPVAKPKKAAKEPPAVEKIEMVPTKPKKAPKVMEVKPTRKRGTPES